MTLPPWEYLFTSFSSRNFPDIFHPTWIASLVLLVVLGVMYYVADARAAQAPALRRPVGVAVVDRADHVQPDRSSRRCSCSTYILVLLTQVVGLGTLVWIRFVRFPPILRAHEQRLARERYYTKQKFADPEATIRKRSGGGGRRSQRRRRR